MRLVTDGVPVWLVNPDSGVDVPALKHKAAVHGASVTVSRVVPLGEILCVREGFPRLEDAPS